MQKAGARAGATKKRIVVTFAPNRSRQSLSYKEWFPPPIKRAAGNGKLLPNCEASFRAHSLARGALLSTHQLLTMILPGRLHAADSNVTKKSSKKSLVRR